MQLLFSFDWDMRVEKTLMQLSLRNSHATIVLANVYTFGFAEGRPRWNLCHFIYHTSSGECPVWNQTGKARTVLM